MNRPQIVFEPYPDPKISHNQKLELKKLQKKKLFNHMSRPKNFLELYLDPKNCPLGPQKVKKDPKIK